jgi:hypothetical protein
VFGGPAALLRAIAWLIVPGMLAAGNRLTGAGCAGRRRGAPHRAAVAIVATILWVAYRSYRREQTSPVEPVDGPESRPPATSDGEAAELQRITKRWEEMNLAADLRDTDEPPSGWAVAGCVVFLTIFVAGLMGEFDGVMARILRGMVRSEHFLRGH